MESKLSLEHATAQIARLFIVTIVVVAGIVLAMSLPRTAFAKETSTTLTAQKVPSQFKGDNVTGHANSIELLYSDYGEYGTSTFRNYDVTGDGRRDTLKLVLSEPNLRFFINGKLAGELKCDGGSPSCWAVLHTLKNGTPIIYARFTEDNEGCFVCYRYSKNRLKKIASHKSILKNAQGQHLQPLVSVKGNKLIIWYGLNTHALGLVEAKFVYTCKKGKMVQSQSTSTLNYYSDYFAKRGKLTVVAAKTFTAYKGTKLKKKAFEVKRGNRIKFTALSSKSGNLFVKVKKGKKSGWVRAGSSALYRGALEYEW